MTTLEEVRCRELLEVRKKQLTEQVGDRLHRHGLEVHPDAALPRRSEDTDDDATADAMREADVAALERAAHGLALIDAAYERLKGGRYGICVDCGDPIRPERLLAYPEAARCSPCQALFERAQARLPHRVPF